MRAQHGKCCAHRSQQNNGEIFEPTTCIASKGKEKFQTGISKMDVLWIARLIKLVVS